MLSAATWWELGCSSANCQPRGSGAAEAKWMACSGGGGLLPVLAPRSMLLLLLLAVLHVLPAPTSHARVALLLPLLALLCAPLLCTRACTPSACSCSC